MWSELLLKLSFLTAVPVLEQPVDLGKSSVWVVDSEEITSPEQAIEKLSQNHEGPSPKGANLGFKKNDYWFLNRIRNQQSDDKLMLRYTFHNLGKIELWTNTGEGWKTYPIQGRMTDPRERSFYGRTSNFLLELKPNQDMLILTKISTKTPLNANMTINTVNSYLSIQATENRILIAAYGISFVMGFYYLILYWQRRQLIDLVYAGSTFFSGLVNGFLQGHFYQYITGLTIPNLHETMNTILVPPTWLFMFEFGIMFLSLKRFFPAGQTIFRFFQVLALVQPILFLAMGFRVSNIFSQIYGLIAPISILLVAVVAWRKGQNAARFFVIAYAMYLSSIVIYLLKNMGLIAWHDYFSFSMVIGSALQVTLLALALGDRMKILKEQKAATERAQQAEEAKHREEVLAWNASLESRIREQTRDIRSMLDHAKIGLMSVTGDLEIHKDYARFLEHILEEDSIAGRPFLDVLLDRLHLGPDDKNKILTAIEYSIGEDAILFEANSSVFPREVAITVGDKTKYLDFDWSPVVNKEGNVERILVSLRDQTENLKLRAEAEEGRKHLRYLGELLEVGPIRYSKFDHSADQTWVQCFDLISAALSQDHMEHESIRKIYVGLHTIKGVARMYKLSDLTQAIHLAEECVAGKTTLNREEVLGLEEALKQVVTSQSHYKKTIEPLYKLREQLQHSSSVQLDPHSLASVLQEMADIADSLAKEIGKGGCHLSIEVQTGLHLTPEYAKAFADSLVHLVRNSVDHGLETPEERVAKGKAPTGTIRFFHDQKGRICLEDDGKGLNLEAIRRKAEKLGRQEEDPLALANLIFDSGFSTKAAANDISGRGVGMDAVREFMRSVGSDIEIVPHSVEGGYMKFHFAIELPQQSLRKAS